MQKDIKHRLVDINRRFYSRFAAPFAETRQKPQPGFERLLHFVPVDSKRILDVGCGEGRFGRYILQQFPDLEYVGVDFSPGLTGQIQLDARVFTRDLTQPGSLNGLGKFDAIACLATLQHIPGREDRIQLLKKMADQLNSEGVIFLSNWQFLTSTRQRRKILDWSEVELTDDDVEDNDFLLSWQRDGFGVRYVTYIDESETQFLAKSAGLRIVEQYRSDGREGDLNLYSILQQRMMPF